MTATPIKSSLAPGPEKQLDIRVKIYISFKNIRWVVRKRLFYGNGCDGRGMNSGKRIQF